MRKRGTMDESGVGYFEIAGKNYTKEELKEKVELFFRNLIKTNELVHLDYEYDPNDENFDPDDESFNPEYDRFQIAITQDVIDFLIKAFNQIDLSSWDELSYHSCIELCTTSHYSKRGYYLSIYSYDCCYNTGLSQKYDVGDIYIDIHEKYVLIRFRVKDKSNNREKDFILSDMDEFIKIYKEMESGVFKIYS